MSNTSGNENVPGPINVPDEVLETPLRLPRNAAIEDVELSPDLKNAMNEGLDIISNPKTKDIKILLTFKDIFNLCKSKLHYEYVMNLLMTKMIKDASNATKIIKYMYLLNFAQKNNVILQAFNEVMSKTLKDLNEVILCYGLCGIKSFAIYFMAGVHFMRDRASPPDDSSRSKLLDIAQTLIQAPMKTESSKTLCLLLLRYYHYCSTYDDESTPQRSDWSMFKKLQSLVVKRLKRGLFSADISIFVEFVRRPCLFQDHGYVSYIETLLSKSDYEDLVPSFIIWVPSSYKEYFKSTFGSCPYLHYL